jgi:hypothetical protein
MGINQVPIVNQYADINRRLTEIEKGDKQQGFCFPDGVSIITAADVHTTDRSGMYFILRYDSMYLVRTRTSTGETLQSDRGRTLIKYLLQYFPNLKYSETEIMIGNSGVAWLKKEMGMI